MSSFNSNSIAAMNPIDISSSDSEDDGVAYISSVGGSSNTRVLPSWPGSNGQSQRLPSPKRPYSANGSSSSITYDHSLMRQQSRLGVSDDFRLSNQLIGPADDSHPFVGNGNLNHPPAVNSRISNVAGTICEKISSHQALKRTLPTSLLPSMQYGKSNNSLQSFSSSQTQDNYASTLNLAGPSSTNSGGYMRDYYVRDSNEKFMLPESNGIRILPTSLMHGRSVQLVGSHDTLYHSLGGEERAAGSDERVAYEAAVQNLHQPKFEATLPDGLLSVHLLRHQKIALAWMLQRETRSAHCAGGILADDQGLGKTVSMIALIQMQKFLEPKSEERCNKKVEPLNLDDDDDDNGGSSLDKVKQVEDTDDVKLVPEVSDRTKPAIKGRPAAGTLVICPASVLRQWARELDDKVAVGAKLSVLLYHGGSRTKEPAELANYDMVLTTYSIVTNEVPKQPLVNEDEVEEKDGESYGLSFQFSSNNKKKKAPSNVSKKRKSSRKDVDIPNEDSNAGPLAKVKWLRVVLDEGQTIKNHRTQVARACCSLRAKKRWCLSGTPIQNTIDDLYSYFRFLRYEPYSTYKSFYSMLKVPISKNTVNGYKKLQAVLRTIMLRRTKGTLIDGQPIIKLPPKSIQLTKIDFLREERAFYTRLEADSRSKFKAYAAAGTVNQNYASILLMLLRLRQACDHPLLVKGSISDSVGKDSIEMAKGLPRDMVYKLLDQLATSSAICRICNDVPEDPVVTLCGHVFCYPCVSDYLTGDDNTCPACNCKEQLGSDVVFSEATLINCISDNVDARPMQSEFSEKSMILQNEYTSSKIRAVIDILQSHCKVNSSSLELNDSAECVEVSVYSNSAAEKPIKSIVFSQWTKMLDLVEMSLNQHCIQYRRLDGTMSLSARDRAVKDFNADPEVTVMLMSLKAGNLGLNMVAACHVILLDLWWNPTTEDQAIDRAHRIGQTRPVTVTRLTIKDTVEDRILALQEEKRKMVASAFGEDQSGGSATRLTVEDLRYLFMV